MQELKTKEDIKIFILYLLENVGMPLELEDINDMARQDDFVKSIDFMECFMELIDLENIAMTKTNDTQVPKYEITPKGSAVVEVLKDNLSGYVRARSVKSAMRYLSFKNRGATLESRIENDGENTKLVGVIKEDGNEIFSFSFMLENDYQLQLMKHNFEEDPERIYKAFMSILTGDTGYLGI
jgi:hypothetical protein